MGLETATYVASLVATNPPSSDKKKQGDDHLRLIKGALLATFPNADRPFYINDVRTVSAHTTLASTDDNMVVLVDTASGSRNITLPTTTIPGFTVTIIKSTTDANAVYVLPPSGTINGHAKQRLGIPYFEYEFVWTGSVWLRIRKGEPAAGTYEPCGATATPAGWYTCLGQAISRTDHPELFAAFGTTYGAGDGSTTFNLPDLAGQTLAQVDASQSRILTGFFGAAPTTIGNSGGDDSTTLIEDNLPIFSEAFTTSVENQPHTHLYDPEIGDVATATAGPNGSYQATSTVGSTSVSTGNPSVEHTHNVTVTFGGGVAFSRIQPTRICNILVRAI